MLPSQLRRRIRVITPVATAAVMVWLFFMAISIWRFGNEDQGRPADCIVVLGAAARGGAPSPVFEERIRHGVSLYHRGLSSRLLFTGGFGEGSQSSESATGRDWAIAQGVPAAAILIEEKSRTTRQNLDEAAQLMKANGLHSAIIVSDPLHMKRSVRMARDLGIDAVSSPTPSSRYRSLGPKLGFLFRELYFYHHYLVTGD